MKSIWFSMGSEHWYSLYNGTTSAISESKGFKLTHKHTTSCISIEMGKCDQSSHNQLQTWVYKNFCSLPQNWGICNIQNTIQLMGQSMLV